VKIVLDNLLDSTYYGTYERQEVGLQSMRTQMVSSNTGSEVVSEESMPQPILEGGAMTVKEVEDVLGFYKLWRISEYLADTGRYIENAYFLKSLRDQIHIGFPEVMPIYALLKGNE
jgi:hypothetical protein